MSTAAGVDTSTTDPTVRRRRAIRGAFFGFLVDSFDIYLPSVALLPAMIYFTQGLDPAQTAVVTGFTLAATLFGRPIGAFLFGHLSDRLGRKRVGAIAIYGFSVVTVLIACLPGAEQIGGVAAISLLLLLRFVDGIFLGGEYTAATPMAIEYAKTNRRGLVGGFVQSASTVGYLAIGVFTFVALQIAPASDIDSAYVQWGWRIPFVVGAVFGFIVARFLRKDVEESVVWITSEKAKHPIREMLGRRGIAAFIQVFILMTGVFFMVNMVGSVVPQLIIGRGFTPNEFSLSIIFANIVVPFAYMLSGLLSDRFGRKPILLTAGLLVLLVMTSLFWLLGSDVPLPFGVLIAVIFFVQCVNGFTIGTLPSYINERFPTRIRSSGWGIGYSLAVVIPGFFAAYQAGLSNFMPLTLTPVVLLVIAGLLIIGSVLASPETRGIDLAGEEMVSATARKKAAPAVADADA
ncbi:MFS transporter [Homoserinibacter sp. YIM 151385]|uniref:MFS transporter n=1 Tax=Homoserinibacter sp. YIM 151385 TaxID=2985506 RepID=UPI0022F06595|nr:MFS transporter [Homoserinibacter sp. YIM 151385]WBU37082.1 MFS transporter [Homoserinibacter sp. YIM 151385]